MLFTLMPTRSDAHAHASANAHVHAHAHAHTHTHTFTCTGLTQIHDKALHDLKLLVRRLPVHMTAWPLLFLPLQLALRVLCPLHRHPMRKNSSMPCLHDSAWLIPLAPLPPSMCPTRCISSTGSSVPAPPTPSESPSASKRHFTVACESGMHAAAAARNEQVALRCRRRRIG